jgi:predicted membrane channel-forming protein YqfA (hemolysin III family)
VQSLPLPLAMSSKVLQILTLIRTKDSGAVSAATWGMATYTAGGQIYITAHSSLLYPICSHAYHMNKELT